jgi:hypothetical protein
MRDRGGVAHQRALRTSRTELMRVHRETTLAGYRHSGVVSGYYRLASKSVRTISVNLSLCDELQCKA